MKPSLLLALALCLLSTEVRLAACSCARIPTPTCQAAKGATAVFVGEVVDMAEVKLARGEKAPFPFYARRVSLKVIDVLKGELEGESVVIHTGAGGGDCGYAFSKGKSYLIYAHRNTPEVPLTTTICSRTRPLGQAKSDLEDLRKRCVD